MMTNSNKLEGKDYTSPDIKMSLEDDDEDEKFGSSINIRYIFWQFRLI